MLEYPKDNFHGSTVSVLINTTCWRLSSDLLLFSLRQVFTLAGKPQSHKGKCPFTTISKASALMSQLKRESRYEKLIKRLRFCHLNDIFNKGTRLWLLILISLILDHLVPATSSDCDEEAVRINGLELSVTDLLLSAANTAAFMLMQIKRCSPSAAVKEKRGAFDSAAWTAPKCSTCTLGLSLFSF